MKVSKTLAGHHLRRKQDTPSPPPEYTPENIIYRRRQIRMKNVWVLYRPLAQHPYVTLPEGHPQCNPRNASPHELKNKECGRQVGLEPHLGSAPLHSHASPGVIQVCGKHAPHPAQGTVILTGCIHSRRLHLASSMPLL